MRWPAWVTPRKVAHLFALANIGFLGVDILIAHAANRYAHPVELVPVGFSALAAIALVPGVIRPSSRLAAVLDRVIAWAAIAVGVAGMVFHLQSGFFATRTLHDLVYAAPFIAPLSYVGVGLLLSLLRSDDAQGTMFATWVLVLSLGGFVGNFGLSVLDHAQNGFFHLAEWGGVASASLAVGVLSMELIRPGVMSRAFVWSVLALQVLVGVAGFALHVFADLAHGTAHLGDNFVFGAPPFAPLLFADIAVLAAIGLWARGSRAAATE